LTPCGADWSSPDARVLRPFATRRLAMRLQSPRLDQRLSDLTTEGTPLPQGGTIDRP